MSTHSPWSDFDHDPRRAENAALRAGDRDREVARQVLTEAYADGRLGAEELDQRTTALESPITLGALAGLLTDLVPGHGAVGVPPGGSGRTASSPVPVPVTVHERAVAAYEAERRRTLVGFVVTSVIVSVVYLATVLDAGFYFPWPLIVIAVTGMRLVRVAMSRTDMVAEEARRLMLEERPDES